MTYRCGHLGHRLLAVALFVIAVPSYPLRGQVIPYPSTLHVKPSTGSNGAAGTLANPLKTLTEALSIAYHRNTQVPITTQIDTIKVSAEADPIAPDAFGGFEDCGWTESETPLICPSSRPPFPLRLVPDVDVIGIKHPVTNAKPIIMIDETPPGGGITPYTDWLPGEPKCMIRAAVHASVSGFNIDGSQLADTTPGHSDWVAVHAEAPIGTTISDFGLLGCDIHDWHDGARYVSKQAQTLEATIRGSTFSGFGPIGTHEGHAGIWLIGSGEFEIDILGTTFVGNP